MSDIEKLRKFSFGCMGVFILMWLVPFIWMNIGDKMAEYEASKPPKPGTVAEVDYLRRKGDADKALTQCLQYMSKEQDPAVKEEFRKALSQCLADLYNKLKQERGKEQVDAIYRELAARSPEPDKRLMDQWVNDRLDHVQKDTWDRKWTAAEESLEAVRKELGDEVNETLARRYADYVNRRCQVAMDNKNIDEAEQYMNTVLQLPGYGKSGPVLEQKRRYLENRLGRLSFRNNEAEYDALFDRLVETTRQAGLPVRASVYQDYILDRAERCLRKDDTQWPSAFFAEQLGVSKDSERDGVKRLYQAYQEKRWRAAAEKGDYTRAQGVLAGFAREPELLDPVWCSEQYAACLLMVWQREHNAKRITEARQCLEQVLDKYADGAREYDLIQALKQEWSAVELLARVDPLLSRDRHVAARIVLEAAKTGGRSTQETAILDAKINESLLSCARARAAVAVKTGDRELLGKVRADYRELLDRRTFIREEARWQSAAEELMSLLIQSAETMAAKKDFAGATHELDEALDDTALRIWKLETEKPGADPWKNVPEAVVLAINQKVPAEEPRRRLDMLTEMARKGEYKIPQAVRIEDVRSRIGEAHAVDMAEGALQELAKGVCRDETLAMLRAIFRNYPASEMVAKARGELQEFIRTTGREQQRRNEIRGAGFSLLSDVLGFYVAEVGIRNAADPFTVELKQVLQAAADSCRKTSPRTEVFFLSLLADAMPPGDKDRQRAHKRAMDVGLKLMDQLSGAGLEEPDTVLPSMLPGCSVFGVENRTSYHLMVFAKGPEQFFVRLNPYRRGCAVLKDGTYDVAVIVADEEVRPYRGQQKLVGEYQLSSYVVQTSYGNQGANAFDYSSATGDFALLRTPPGMDAVEVHPATGLVLPAGLKAGLPQH